MFKKHLSEQNNFKFDLKYLFLLSLFSRFGPGTIITELNIPANKCGLVIGKGKTTFL